MATYTEFTWADGSGGGTPLSAANLNAMTAGIAAAHTGATDALEHFTFAIPENYAGIDPTGVADSAAALATALGDAKGSGPCVIPPGTYRIDSRISLTLDDDEDLHVIAHGAKFVCYNASSSSTGRLFKFEPSQTSPTNVSSVTESQSSSYGANAIRITTLAVASTSGIAAGDYVRVMADDVVDGPDVDIRSGQTCKVLEVSGSNVIVAGNLLDPFTTSVRLLRISAARLRWEGGLFTDSAAILAGSTGYSALFCPLLLVRPHFSDMDFLDVMGPAISIYSTWAGLIDNVRFRHLSNDTGIYGYGINDGSELLTATRILAERCRHAYTTAAVTSSAATSDYWRYGRAFGAKVSGTAVCTLATAWDTHGDGRGIQFINCDAHDCESHSQLRGIYNVVRGGMVTGACQSGVVLCNDTSTGGESYGHDISGLVIDGATYRIFVVSHTSHGPSSNPSYFHDCVILSRDTSDPIFYAADSTLHHARIAVAAGGTRTGGSGTYSIAVMTEATDTA